MTTDISFKSPEHKARFVNAMQQLKKVEDGKFDPEYGVALFILTAHLSTWQKANGYISHNGIDFESMLEEVDLSGGYTVLIKLAGNLFNSETHIDPVELMRLDESNFELALAALQLRRYSLFVADASRLPQ